MTYLPKSELVGVLSPSAINTKDVGVNWYDIGSILNANFITYLGNGITIAGNGAGKLYRSVDYGNTWTDSGTVSTGTLNCGTYLGNGIILIGDNVGHIFRSIDFGVSWTDQGDLTGAVAIITISYLGNGIVIFGANRHIFRHINYGDTAISVWTDLGVITASNIMNNSSVYLENGIALIATAVRIWRSIDYGATWVDAVGLTVPFPNKFVYCGNGIVIYVATSAIDQINRSTDYGLTWNTVYNPVIGLLSALYLGNGIVTTHGSNGHVYRSIDFGISFTDLGDITGTATGLSRAATYLDNGIAIIADTSGEFWRSDISYKINEAQVKIEPSFITTTVSMAITQAHYMVNVNATGGDRTITLVNPILLQRGHEFVIKKIDSSINIVTITPIAGTIDGVANKILGTQYQSVTIRTDGTNWFVISDAVTSPVQTSYAMGQLKPNVTRYTQPGWMIVRDDDTITMTGGFIYYIPFYVSTRTTFTETVFIVTSPGGVGSTMIVKIFAWNDGLPGIELVNVGSIGTTSAGTKTLAIANYTLDRGFYFMAMRNNLAVTVRSINWSFPVSCPVGGQTSTTAASTNFLNFIGMTVNSAYVDPAPAPTAITINFPVFKLREN
jgi:photosystem II stability/assembly factor-like uncharacterized protein